MTGKVVTSSRTTVEEAWLIARKIVRAFVETPDYLHRFMTRNGTKLRLRVNGLTVLSDISPRLRGEPVSHAGGAFVYWR
ncbi:MAG: hypothetical protein N3A53_07755, partial [Verrucomicrobiae bacterium]|nr:hypothetical protein [Verrucomicrobiae bacterium]